MIKIETIKNGLINSRFAVMVTDKITGSESIYETNAVGNGLWIDGKQLMGTCDYHAVSAASFAAKLRRSFAY